VVTIVGAITALFMAFLGIIQNDIKRVVAYSTLSQLGYMTVALGVSAYSVAIFHLMTHAFFKALLFLGAGSVIIALHHEQDLRKMGGLRKYMPITYWTAVVGSLALAGIPPFAGFFSKDSIIEAVHASSDRRPRLCVCRGDGRRVHHRVLLVPDAVPRVPRAGALRSPRRIITMPRDAWSRAWRRARPRRTAPKESPWVVTVPLILARDPVGVRGWATSSRW
jgi:NADH-quinone oxidoreductase subunit L